MKSKKIAILNLVLMLIVVAAHIVLASPKEEKKYSKDIANAIHIFLTQDNCRFSFDEEMGIFSFTFGIRDKIKLHSCIIDVAEDSYIVYVFPPISVDAHDKTMLAAVAEYLCRASYGLRNGNFELDFRDGEIRYKSYVDCDEDSIPTRKVIQNSVYCSIVTVQTYIPGLLDVIFGGISAEEAIKKCESQHLIRLLAMLDEISKEQE